METSLGYYMFDWEMELMEDMTGSHGADLLALVLALAVLGQRAHGQAEPLHAAAVARAELLARVTALHRAHRVHAVPGQAVTAGNR